VSSNDMEDDEDDKWGKKGVVGYFIVLLRGSSVEKTTNYRFRKR